MNRSYKVIVVLTEGYNDPCRFFCTKLRPDNGQGKGYCCETDKMEGERGGGTGGDF